MIRSGKRKIKNCWWYVLFDGVSLQPPSNPNNQPPTNYLTTGGEMQLRNQVYLVLDFQSQFSLNSHSTYIPTSAVNSSELFIYFILFILFFLCWSLQLPLSHLRLWYLVGISQPRLFLHHHQNHKTKKTNQTTKSPHHIITLPVATPHKQARTTKLNFIQCAVRRSIVVELCEQLIYHIPSTI